MLLIPKIIMHMPVDRPLIGGCIQACRKRPKACVELLFRVWLLYPVPFGPLILVSVFKIHLAFLSSLFSVFIPNSGGSNPSAGPLRFFTNELPPPLISDLFVLPPMALFCGFGLRQASLLECKWVKHLSFLSVGVPSHLCCHCSINEASAHRVFFVLIWNWQVQQKPSEVGFVIPQDGVVCRWQRSFHHLS